MPPASFAQQIGSMGQPGLYARVLIPWRKSRLQGVLYNRSVEILRDLYHLVRDRGRLIKSVRYSSRAEKFRLTKAIQDLGPWFHNYELATGVWTNDSGFPGSEYPAWRWGFVSRLLPDVKGLACLDVGCSSGFFSLKLKELGAKDVLGVDGGEQTRAIEQCRFAAAQLNLPARFERMSIYDLKPLGQAFDVVLCLGVFYHLRHPLLALENLRAVCKRDLIFQTVTTRHSATAAVEMPAEAVQNLTVQSEVLLDPRFPELKFIEHSLGQDMSCWFVPNVEGVYAMLRSAGFTVEEVMFPSEYDILIRCRV